MRVAPFYTSLTRISDLAEVPYEIRHLVRDRWATGQYVVAEVVSREADSGVELRNGRQIELAEGDRVVGALGRRDALGILLSQMAASSVDAAVVEVGASPLEPYNGDVAVEKIEEMVRMCVLCASDPYAVVGVRAAFGVEPDLVTGIASNTKAGIDLVEELTGLKTLNVRDADAQPELDRLLELHLDLPELGDREPGE